MLDFTLTCSDAPSAIWGLLDFSIAPSLLFYAYVPIIVVSLFLGGFVLVKERYSLRSKLLFIVSVIFTLLILNEMLLWIAAPVSVVEFGWQLEPMFRILVSVFTVYFVYVFINKRDIPFTQKLVLSASYISVILLSSTEANIVFFDLNNCEGVPGWLFDLTHLFEATSMLWVAVITIKNFLQTDISNNERYQNVFLGSGAVLFLLIFFASTFFGDFTQVYQIGLLGPAGMVAFMAFLTFIIVRYKAFNIKLIGAQALIFSLVALIGSQFFFIQSNTNRILTAMTLIITGIIGINLIRSVKKEVEQREELEISNKNLGIANKGQESLIHAMNHQVKGFIGTARTIFAELLTADYGQMPESTKPLLSHGFEEMTKGVDYVQGILKSNSAHSGTLPYNIKPIDLKPLVSNLVSSQKDVAEKKGLSFESNIADADYTMTGDAIMLEEAFKNLITNAIKYNNPNGSVVITLSRTDGKILFNVRDTGRGISKEDEKMLFKPGGMGKDSVRYNTDAAGYGLSFVKPVIEKHQGKIWYETEVGKGTTFFVELPASQKVSATA